MSTKTSTKTKSKTGASSTRPPSRSTRRNPAVEDTTPDEGDTASPGTIPGDVGPPATENQQSSPTEGQLQPDTSSQPGAPPTGAAAGSPEEDNAAGGTSRQAGTSDTQPASNPIGSDAGGILSTSTDPVNDLRLEVSSIIVEAEDIFKSLKGQIKNSFDASARAEGYLQRARREVEAAYRRTEDAQDGINTAMTRFSSRIQRVQEHLTRSRYAMTLLTQMLIMACPRLRSPRLQYWHSRCGRRLPSNLPPHHL